MNADLKGTLALLDTSYKDFTHRGQPMTKDQVREVLEYGIAMGYEHSGQISDHEVDIIIGFSATSPMITEILKKAIDLFGREVQIHKIQEEALELSLVLNQIKCPTKNPKEMEAKLYDELADMKIMMAQAELLFDAGRINKQVRYKLKRFEEKYLGENITKP